MKEGTYKLEHIVQKVAHAPARLFEVKERGFLREGYWADIVVVNPIEPQLWKSLPSIRSVVGRHLLVNRFRLK